MLGKGWLHQVPSCAWGPGNSCAHLVWGTGRMGVAVGALLFSLAVSGDPRPLSRSHSLRVLPQCALCLGRLTLSGAVGPEPLGHPGLHQELPLCRLQGRSTLHFLGRLMGPALLRVQ